MHVIKIGGSAAGTDGFPRCATAVVNVSATSAVVRMNFIAAESIMPAGGNGEYGGNGFTRSHGGTEKNLIKRPRFSVSPCGSRYLRPLRSLHTMLDSTLRLESSSPRSR